MNEFHVIEIPRIIYVDMEEEHIQPGNRYHIPYQPRGVRQYQIEQLRRINIDEIIIQME